MKNLPATKALLALCSFIVPGVIAGCTPQKAGEPIDLQKKQIVEAEIKRVEQPNSADAHSPERARHWEDLAILHEKHKHYEEAEKAMYKSIQCLSSASKLSELADIYAKDHKYDQAATTMLQSITALERDQAKRHQNNYVQEVASNYFKYSKLLKKAGIDSEAQAASDKAHKLDPTLPE